MAKIAVFIITLFVGLFLIACSSDKQGMTTIQGDVLTGPEESSKETQQSAEADISSQVLETVQLTCNDKETIKSKIESKQERINALKNDLEDLNAKLMLALTNADYTTIQSLRFEAEKNVKLYTNEQKNLASLQEELAKCI